MKSIWSTLIGLSLILSFSYLCLGQQKPRTLEKYRSFKAEPVELIGAQVGDTAFDGENKLLADKNWLKDLRLNLKNISGKTIVYITVNLHVERQGKMQYPLVLPLRFGQDPLPDSAKSAIDSSVGKIEVVNPGESVKIAVIPQILQQFTTKFMPENEVQEIEDVKYFFDFVVFDDGTAWSKGRFMYQDPANNNRWTSFKTP